MPPVRSSVAAPARPAGFVAAAKIRAQTAYATGVRDVLRQENGWVNWSGLATRLEQMAAIANGAIERLRDLSGLGGVNS